MQIVLTLLIGWLADWLVRQVPGLDPVQSREVARVLLDHGYQLIITAGLIGWRFLRRPGDAPAAPATAPPDAAAPASRWTSWLR